MTLRPKRPRRRGFTLLEVVAAMAILAVSIMTIVAIRERSIDQAIAADVIRTASMLAERKMGEVVAQGYPPLLPDDGEFENHPEYSWALDVDDVDGSDEHAQMRVVRLTITYPAGVSGTRYRSFVVETVLAQKPTIVLKEEPEL